MVGGARAAAIERRAAQVMHALTMARTVPGVAAEASAPAEEMEAASEEASEEGADVPP